MRLDTAAILVPFIPEPSSRHPDRKVERIHFVGELAWLVVIAAIVHGAVLRLVFPGYYRPLSPHHSDFYIPVSMAVVDYSVVEIFRGPRGRPIGFGFLQLVGQAGLEGSIALILLLVFTSCALLAM